MSAVNWNNVSVITRAKLEEQGTGVFKAPVMTEIFIVIMSFIMHDELEESISSIVSLTMLLSMLIPCMFTINSFIKAPYIIKIVAAGATYAEKYISLLLSVTIRVFLWLLMGSVTGMLILMAVGWSVYSVGAIQVLSGVFSMVSALEFISLIFLNSLIGLWIISSHTPRKTRFVTCAAVIIMLTALFGIVIPLILVMDKTALYSGVIIYALAMTFLSVVWGYYNIKKIDTF